MPDKKPARTKKQDAATSTTKAKSAAKSANTESDQAAKPAKRAATAKRKSAPTKVPARRASAAAGVSVAPEAVAARAYARFAERGYVHGYDAEDWHAAEHELAQEHASEGGSAPS